MRGREVRRERIGSDGPPTAQSTGSDLFFSY